MLIETSGSDADHDTEVSSLVMVQISPKVFEINKTKHTIPVNFKFLKEKNQRG